MKLVMVILILVDGLWSAFLWMLNRRSEKRPLPKTVRDVYDPGEYSRWRAYHAEKSRLTVFRGLANLAAELLLILTDAYAAFARLFPQNDYLQLLAVLFLTTVVSTLAELPFSRYDTFVIEEKYGFNRSSKKTWIADTVKETILSFVLMGGLISLFALIHRALGDWVIVAFAGAFLGIMLLISLLVPVFTRLFNKFTPLEDGQLKEKLTALMNGHGYKVRAIEVMDASRRSTKMNAYFTGFGPMKTIVLYDTLKDATTPGQLCAVFAHELGHGLHHDTLKTQAMTAVQGLLIAILTWLMVRSPAIFADFGFSGVNYGMAFLLMSTVLQVLSPLMGMVISRISCQAEYRADAQAVEEGYGQDLITALKILSKGNYADLSPDPLLVKLTYDHPTLDQRIRAIQKKLAEQTWMPSAENPLQSAPDGV